MTCYTEMTELVGFLWAKLIHIPYYLEVDGARLHEESFLKKHIKRFLIKGAKGYISSGRITDNYLVHYGVPQDRIFHYPFSSLYSSDILKAPVSDEQKQSLKSCFEYRKGSGVFRIPTKDIAYFVSADKKIRFTTKDGEEEFYGKLKNVMEELPDDFMMIHQSYIVNQLYVSEYAYDCVKMSDGTVFSISRPYRKEIRGKIKQYRRAEIYGEL